MKKLLATFLICLIPSLVSATVSFNNANTMGQDASVGSATYTFSGFTVTAGGTNTYAFACIAYDSTAGLVISSATPPTYGGNVMTLAGTAALNATGAESAAIYYLKNPPTSSSSLVVTMSGTTDELYANVVSFKNVNTTTPVRSNTYITQTGSASTLNLAITSNTNDLTMSCVNAGSVGATFAGTQTTSDSVNNSGSYGAGSDHATSPLSTVTSKWTVGNYAIAGLSVDGDTNGVPNHVNAGSVACNSNVTTCPLTYSPTAGDMVVVTVFNNGSGAITAPTDNATGGSTTYSSAMNGTCNPPSGSFNCAIYYTCSVKSGVSTISGNWSTDTGNVYVQEFSGMNSSSCLDKVSTEKTGTGTTQTSNTVTTTSANEALTGFCLQNNTSVNFANSGSFISDTNVNNTLAAALAGTLYQIVSAIGTYNLSASTNPSSVTWSCYLATFSAPASGGASVPYTAWKLPNTLGGYATCILPNKSGAFVIIRLP